MLMSDKPHSSARVLMVAPQPFYEDRGTPIAIRHVLEALSKAGHMVDLLTFSAGADISLPGLRILRVGGLFGIKNIPIGFSLKKLLLDIVMTFALLRMLRRQDYWCVHAVEEAVFPALVIGRHRGIPVIYDMQSSLPDQLSGHPLFGTAIIQRFLQRCERWALRHAAIVVGSAGLKPYVMRTEPGARVEEWNFPGQPHNPDPAQVAARRHACEIGDNAPVVLYSGNFARYQGVDSLIEAIPGVLAQVPDTVFVLIGGDRDSFSPDIRKTVEAVPQGSIRILPRQPRDALPSFIAMADILVSPRAGGDNLPLKVFDYIAAGKAIVATDYPIHRTILDESCAMLVEPRAEAIADGIVHLLQDPALARRLGAAARSRSETDYGLAPFQRFVDQVYRGVSGGGKLAARRP